MNAFQLGKIVSAVVPVTAKLSQDMSGNVRICPEMSGRNSEIDKTNPNQGKEKIRSKRAPKPLSPRQLTAVALLLRGKSAAGVGRLLGIDERTVRRWQHDPRFIAEVKERSAPFKTPMQRRTAPQGYVFESHGVGTLAK